MRHRRVVLAGVVALLGRFLPRLGPSAPDGPFSFVRWPVGLCGLPKRIGLPSAQCAGAPCGCRNSHCHEYATGFHGACVISRCSIAFTSEDARHCAEPSSALLGRFLPDSGRPTRTALLCRGWPGSERRIRLPPGARTARAARRTAAWRASSGVCVSVAKPVRRLERRLVEIEAAIDLELQGVHAAARAGRSAR